MKLQMVKSACINIDFMIVCLALIAADILLTKIGTVAIEIGSLQKHYKSR
jgi:hypothetical protein